MEPTQTIQLNENIVKLIEGYFTSIQTIQKLLGDLQKQFAEKQKEAEATQSKLEGVIVGVLTAEGVDLENGSIKITEDFKQIQVFSQKLEEMKAVVNNKRPKTKIKA